MLEILIQQEIITLTAIQIALEAEITTLQVQEVVNISNLKKSLMNNIERFFNN